MSRVGAFAFLSSPIVGLLACLVTHALMARTAPTVSRPVGVVASVIAGLAVVIALGVAFAVADPQGMALGDRIGAGVLWAAAYVALAYAYVFGFFNVGESARRVRLLIELYAAGERGLTKHELLASYNARMIVEARLHRMLAGGQIEERGGNYVIKRRVMLGIAKIFVVMKLIFFGARSELIPRRPRQEPS